MKAADFPASTRQLHSVPEFRQYYSDLSKLIPEPIEGEIRLAGTRRVYKVLIDIYALPPNAVGLDIWAQSDDARLRIGQHRDFCGRINVTLGALQFDATLNSYSSEVEEPEETVNRPPDPRDRQ